MGPIISWKHSSSKTIYGQQQMVTDGLKPTLSTFKHLDFESGGVFEIANLVKWQDEPIAKWNLGRNGHSPQHRCKQSAVLPSLWQEINYAVPDMDVGSVLCETAAGRVLPCVCVCLIYQRNEVLRQLCVVKYCSPGKVNTVVVNRPHITATLEGKIAIS